MDAMARVEGALTTALSRMSGPGCPPRLAEAVRHAVFPGGSRLRPRLCLAVAAACGDDAPGLADATAAAIELLHCASLVHDDMPCFDNAEMRRGRASVHHAYGEPLALLVGDALIVVAFEQLARAGTAHPERIAPLLLMVGGSVGAPTGIIAGQAWECEDEINLSEYHQQKTGALFAAATMAGATAAGADPEAWRALGERLGEAYQVLDDIRDVAAKPEEIGKPTGQDRANDRPSAALQLGLAGAVRRLDELSAAAIAAIPDCPGQAALQAMIHQQVSSLLPKKLRRAA
ncbi:polyprenyl synthetase family protein [Magnetospirillum molischianum]|uniref:Geranylgeranyl pyrophosphate synthetase (GGPP synthetase) (Farnesyltranstransferase) n=1 Tax=Magnetospirillum molischianum DSM 120 TaxID=1150626 RepID=H8FR67_MAGML|nr:polyprenyl synthetase family protein [Magnetospirillum molischianum]CCG40855.1 Geranylgeranyl pyrophosphate synthetase (GGPP synthetase) (Farnesyltranstransferase) [Magnetospirillum molischianum DSM 120]